MGWKQQKKYNNDNNTEIASMQKLCIFMQTKCKKCIVKILMCPRTYFESWIDFVVWVTCKKFSNKANSHRGCRIGFNYTKGTGDNLHIRETWMSSCHVCLLFDWLCWSSAHLHVHVPVIWQWTMKREEDKWLKEFGWLQTRGSGNDLLIICKDCTKAGKKNMFMRECKISKDQCLWRLTCMPDTDYAILFISFCQKLITHWSKVGLSIL